MNPHFTQRIYNMKRIIVSHGRSRIRRLHKAIVLRHLASSSSSLSLHHHQRKVSISLPNIAMQVSYPEHFNGTRYHATASSSPAPAAASSSSSSEEVKALLLPYLDPSDFPLALSIIASTAERQQQLHQQQQGVIDIADVGISPLIVCNQFLIQLAKSDDIALLDKAFAYLGRIRSVDELRAVPSLPARNEMIRGRYDQVCTVMRS